MLLIFFVAIVLFTAVYCNNADFSIIAMQYKTDAAFGLSIDPLDSSLVIYGQYLVSSTGTNNLYLTRLWQNGTKVWAVTFGTVEDEFCGYYDPWFTVQTYVGNAPVIDPQTRDIFVHGSTFGSMDGVTSVFDITGFYSRYSLNGTRLWIKMYGQTNTDENCIHPLFAVTNTCR